MDVLEDAIYDFSEVLEYFDDWKTAVGKTKAIELEDVSIERYLFWMTMKRHVTIARKLMIDLYNCFDIYIVEKNKNPFVVKRPGKPSKKIEFRKNRYKVQVESNPDDICPLFHGTTKDSFTTEELKAVNKVYNGTVKICRLQKFMEDRKKDEPSEKGEQVIVEVRSVRGEIVRGVLTFSPNGSTEKETDKYLEVTDSCKNMCGIEMHFIGDVEFGLKLILAKLKRMKSPYLTPIIDVVKLGDDEVTAVQEVGDAPPVDQLQHVAGDGPPEGMREDAKVAKQPEEKAIEVIDQGTGDSSIPDVGWTGPQLTSDLGDDKFRRISECPDLDDESQPDSEPRSHRQDLSELYDELYKVPIKNSFRSSCTIQ